MEIRRLAEKLGVSNRVYILGFVDEKIKINMIDFSVALVLPSVADYVEVYPGVISEAWAREKPVIASNIGGIPYRVKDGVNGILVAPANPKILSDAMLKLIRHPELAKKMGGNGKTDVLTWGTIAKKSIEVYIITLNASECKFISNGLKLA